MKSPGRSGRCKVTRSHLVCTCTAVAVLVAVVLSSLSSGPQTDPLPWKAVYNGPPKVLWGDAVTIGGKTQNVSDYFAEHVSEDDIKKYLL